MLAPLPTEQKTHLPQRLKMSYEEYLEFAPDSQKIEWVNGEAIIYMPATPPHQRLIVFLVNLLQQFTQIFNLGIVQIAPIEVKLWPDGPSREPDILFIANDGKAQETSKRIEGAPDLVVEIISPGSVTIDRRDKYQEYEQAGVKEYWLIDPRPRHKRATFFTLDDEGFLIPAALDAEGCFHSSVLPGFWINPTWLWQTSLPNEQIILAEIILSMDNLDESLKNSFQMLHQTLTRFQKKQL